MLRNSLEIQASVILSTSVTRCHAVNRGPLGTARMGVGNTGQRMPASVGGRDASTRCSAAPDRCSRGELWGWGEAEIRAMDDKEDKKNLDIRIPKN